jgi:hypothetical protein
LRKRAEGGNGRERKAARCSKLEIEQSPLSERFRGAQFIGRRYMRSTASAADIAQRSVRHEERRKKRRKEGRD